MRRAATVLLLLFAPAWNPAWAQMADQAPRPPSAFDVTLAISVFSAAFAFIAPRALDAVTVQELALWGLGAPGSLDGALATELRDGTIVLLQDGRLVFSRALPADDSPGSWGVLVGQVLEAAARVSPAFAAAGTQGAVTAVFDSIFDHLDPYSRYVPPAAAEVDRARRSGDAGIGVTLAQTGLSRGRSIVVTGVNADGPGAEAGIRIGDRIVAVDGQPVAGEDLDTVKGWIGGLEGTDLSVTVQTRSAPSRTLEIERAVTPPETVFASRLGDILVLRITSFSVDTDQRVQRELERGMAGPLKGIVLDLRGNRGGLLRQAIATIDLVLGHGVVATTAGRNPQADHQWLATPGDLVSGRPIVVLVDGRSASAAEIMAAAFADEGRGVVVGSSTLGKGLVQTIATLPDGGELFVSWSRVLSPTGWPLQGLGVLPQVCTSLGPEALMRQLDALNHGIQPMAAELVRHRAARAPVPADQALAIRSACPASEPRDADMMAARYLFTHPAAYAAARLSSPGPQP